VLNRRPKAGGATVGGGAKKPRVGRFCVGGGGPARNAGKSLLWPRQDRRRRGRVLAALLPRPGVREFVECVVPESAEQRCRADRGSSEDGARGEEGGGPAVELRCGRNRCGWEAANGVPAVGGGGNGMKRVRTDR